MFQTITIYRHHASFRAGKKSREKHKQCYCTKKSPKGYFVQLIGSPKGNEIYIKYSRSKNNIQDSYYYNQSIQSVKNIDLKIFLESIALYLRIGAFLNIIETVFNKC